MNGIWYSDVEAFWRDIADPALRTHGFEVEAVQTVCGGAWKRFYSSTSEHFWLYFYVEVKDPGCSGLHVVAPRHFSIGERITAYFARRPRLDLDGVVEYPLNRKYLENLFTQEIELFRDAKDRIRDHWSPPGAGS